MKGGLAKRVTALNARATALLLADGAFLWKQNIRGQLREISKHEHTNHTRARVSTHIQVQTRTNINIHVHTDTGTDTHNCTLPCSHIEACSQSSAASHGYLPAPQNKITKFETRTKMTSLTAEVLQSRFQARNERKARAPMCCAIRTPCTRQAQYLHKACMSETMWQSKVQEISLRRVIACVCNGHRTCKHTNGAGKVKVLSKAITLVYVIKY